MIDQATQYKSHSPATQHQVFQSLFKAYRKNSPKSSTLSRVPLGQDEKQIHIYQSLNKKTINHWKYLMQNSDECLLKANSTEHGVTQEYRVKSNTDCLCRYAQPIHDTKIRCPLPTQIKIYKSCRHSPQFTSLTWKITAFLLFMTCRVQWIKFVLVNLTISRVFSEVWQYQRALPCCCKEWWYIVAWYALWSLLLHQSTWNFCLVRQQRQMWGCLFARGNVFLYKSWPYWLSLANFNETNLYWKMD